MAINSSIPTYVSFSHPSSQVGQLVIENGMDLARWGYNLNTATFPTYGGEVVQILSVYINDLTVGGTLSTYSQAEAVYSYFASYLQIATQGRNPTPKAGTSAYNLQPITLFYPQRNWRFSIYPKSVPGFRLAEDVVTPLWQLTAHVIDDSPNLNPIKAAIKEKAVSGAVAQFAKINDEISPLSGNPESNPFQVFDQGASKAAAAIKGDADYYNSLIPAYSSGDFAALTGGLGSRPSSAATGGAAAGQQVTVPTPSGKSTGGGSSGGHSSVSHNAEYQKEFQNTWRALYTDYTQDGCAGVHTGALGSGLDDPSASATAKRARRDAVDSFKRAPYSCSNLP